MRPSTMMSSASASPFSVFTLPAKAHVKGYRRPSSNEERHQQRFSTPNASKCVEQLVEGLHPKFSESMVTPFTIDGSFHNARRFLECQQQFRASGKPIQAEIAFHYTSTKKLTSIRSKGLQADMPQRNGSAFGSGIYVGTNPHAFLSYGNVGIILLYLPGCTRQVANINSCSQDSSSDENDGIDTVRGNKLMAEGLRGTTFPKSPYFDELVIQRREQALPLLIFPTEITNNPDLLFELQRDLQKLVDRALNDSRTTAVRRVLPSMEDLQFEHNLRSRHQKRATKKVVAAVASVMAVAVGGIFECSGPRSGSQQNLDIYTVQPFPPSSDCPICMELLNQNGACISLRTCQHMFHLCCMQKALQNQSSCPVCRSQLVEPFGKCPKGTMTVQLKSQLRCHGYSPHGTYVINYDIPGGTQSSCHEAPGHRFRGTRRQAYVPDLPSTGRDLVKRLKYAFEHGLTFSVGTSLTSGRSNVVVWTSIHHKTSLSAEQHGFPDPGFFYNCNDELDAAGVPKAVNL